MKRPAALDLFLVAAGTQKPCRSLCCLPAELEALSFGVSALCAAATDLIPWKLRELPTSVGRIRGERQRERRSALNLDPGP